MKGRVNREKETPRQREIQIFHLLVHSVTGFTTQVWASPKSADRSFFPVSQKVGSIPSIWAMSCCFPRHILRESVEKWRFEPGHKWATRFASGFSTHCITVSTLLLFVKKEILFSSRNISFYAHMLWPIIVTCLQLSLQR